MDELFPYPPNQQATNQILAIVVTLAFALVGGLITGTLQTNKHIYCTVILSSSGSGSGSGSGSKSKSKVKNQN